MSDEKITLDCDTYGSGQNAGVCIICAPTGIICTVQANGMACSHPEAEGFPIEIHCYEDFYEALEKFDDCSWGCCLGVNEADDSREEHLNKYATAIDEF